MLEWIESSTGKRGNLEFIFDKSFFIHRHSPLVFLEVAALGGLQVEPRVRERLDMRQQSLDERMEFILRQPNNVNARTVSRITTRSAFAMKT